MWKNKKFIIIAILVVLVVGGSLGGIAIAQADDQSSSANETAVSSFMSKVAEIYEQNTNVPINADELQKAFIEAGQAMKSQALDNYLQKLVDEKKISQEDADNFKAWLAERPAFPTDEFQQWMQSRPDIPGLFGDGSGPGIRPFGGMREPGKFGMGFRGMFGGRFGGGWCAPNATDNTTD
jgi:hypothetical protein